MGVAGTQVLDRRRDDLGYFHILVSLIVFSRVTLVREVGWGEEAMHARPRPVGPVPPLHAGAPSHGEEYRLCGTRGGGAERVALCLFY